VRWWFLLIVSVTVAMNVIVLPWERGSALAIAIVVACAVQALLVVVPITDVFVERFLRKHQTSDPHAAEIATSAGILRFLALVVVYAMVLVLAAQNLGIDVTALIAGLGVGGVAIALAVQNILGDLFAALSIVLDKPFVVGDFIVVDKQMGTVERVGLKTTRVRANTGEQLVFGNSDLLKSRIQNFKRMQERWVLNTVRVEYGTDERHLAELPGVFRRIVEAKGQVRFDRSHLARLGESSIELEFAFYMLTADHATYMDTQQAINLDVLRECRERAVRIALPGQAVHIVREPAAYSPEHGKNAPSVHVLGPDRQARASNR
jgi:small-conductance mechanosensitive channel